MDDVHHVEQLTFVFMDPFDLDVKQGVDIDRDPTGTSNQTGQGLFVGLFGG
jgi:hypothetical protein